MKLRWGWCGSGNYTRVVNVEAMQVRWYGSGSEAVLVERTRQRWVYTIGISQVVCGKQHKHAGTKDTIG